MRKIEVKLPNGKAVTLSQAMSPQEKAARIDEIKAVLASFEQDTTARHQEPVPATDA